MPPLLFDFFPNFCYNIKKEERKISKMPKTLDELAQMIAKRDSISYNEALAAVRDAAAEMELAFMNGSLQEAEDILHYDLGLEPDYLDLFIM